tara:strand:+ start:42257 stop:43933 length:1677 start_codon:yes stop_codon:yes gene_type:complete
MKNCVYICCDDNYVAKAIVALHMFLYYNPGYDCAIIGTLFNRRNKRLCLEYNVQLLEIDLSDDFIYLDKRPYGLQYPIECFYHFYGYKILSEYDYLVLLECDIGTYKKLDIDFTDVKYIAGTHNIGKISQFSAIKRDFLTIKEKFGEGDVNQTRIIGGLKIYNVKNLNDISFYETIVEYYKKSLEYNIPRCGDDSLMVLYQLLNKDKIYFLNNLNHILSTRLNTTNFYSKMNDICCVHFVGLSKYWKIHKDNDITTFFKNNMIEFVYNNFSIDFIEKHVPEIYVSLTNIQIPFYYYGSELNFGDFITPYFLNKFCYKKDYSFDCKSNNNKKIISCGSIMRLSNMNTIVYGSGIRDIDQQISKGNIHCVRGPLTGKRVIDVQGFCPPVYGDPGLLLPLYYKPSVEKKYKLGIIPHVIHYKQVVQQYNDRNDILVIDLATDNVEYIIDIINSCEKIVSSSLHGLIVSDAYNVPNKWVKFNDKINGDDTKFYDYFQSVNRKDQDYIDCYNYKRLPDNVTDLIKNVDNNYDIQKLKDKMFFDENGIKNYTKYLFSKLINENI